jgi:hypothetical protein
VRHARARGTTRGFWQLLCNLQQHSSDESHFVSQDAASWSLGRLESRRNATTVQFRETAFGLKSPS